MTLFPRSTPSLRRIAPVTFWLIAAQVLVSLWTWLGVASPEGAWLAWGLVPERFVAEFGPREVLTLFTSMFLHGGLLHIAFNAMMLYFLGRLIEPSLGSRRMALVYAGSGIVAAFAQLAWDPASPVPMIGASGAISGLFGAALVLVPKVRLLIMTPFTLFIPVPMQLQTFAWLWVALQLVGLAFADPFDGGIAYMAHLGGFAAGFFALSIVAMMLDARRTAARASYAARIGRGPAPNPSYRTFYVTDGYGQTWSFHEPR